MYKRNAYTIGVLQIRSRDKSVRVEGAFLVRRATDSRRQAGIVVFTLLKPPPRISLKSIPLLHFLRGENGDENDATVKFTNAEVSVSRR